MELPKTYVDKVNEMKNSRWIKAQVKKDLETCSVETVMTKIDKNEYGFNHTTFSKLKQRQKEEDDYISNPYEVEEGVVQCGKCNSFKVYSVSAQTRAADEPMTTIAFCTVCKNRWTQNG